MMCLQRLTNYVRGLSTALVCITLQVTQIIGQLLAVCGSQPNVTQFFCTLATRLTLIKKKKKIYAHQHSTGNSPT